MLRYLQQKEVAVLVIGFGVLTVLPLGVEGHFLNLLVRMLLFGLFAASLDLIWGYTGILSFGHAVFFGVGGYIAAYTMAHLTQSILVIMLIAFIVGAVFAVVIFLPPVKTKTTGVYIAVISLIYSLVFHNLGIHYHEYTGGYTGLVITDWPTLGPFEITGTSRYYYLVLVVVMIGTMILYWIVNSSYGLVFQAIRENPTRTTMVGYNTQKYQLVSLMLAGGFASVAGSLFAPFNASIYPQIFGFELSGLAILYVLLGGAGTIIGPFLGTALIFLPETYVSSLFPGAWMYVVGVLFVVLVLYFPEGIVNFVSTKLREWND